MMEQNDGVVAKSYGSIPFDPRPARRWNQRMIRSPLDMSAASGMYATSLNELSKGKFRRMIERFMGLGMSKAEARQAVMRMIEAGHISGRTL